MWPMVDVYGWKKRDFLLKNEKNLFICQFEQEESGVSVDIFPKNIF